MINPTEFITYLSIYIGLFISVYYLLNMSLHVQRKYLFEDLKIIPKVSIIIPAYNEEKGIARTIQSALEIEYPANKLEIIVVDDGSRDKTFSIASKLSSDRVKVFKMSKNSGKGAAMNFAISKASGEIIITMDADNTRVTPDALKKMIPYFQERNVMCVAPSMLVYNPRTILERIQQIEYTLGVFLRKAFASVNAVHITPGAFSAYRKSFFDKYGGFSDNNITEDLEMALRIQSYNFIIENVPQAVIYTVVPTKFVALLKQRRRWYFGMLKNLIEYRKLFSKKYGDLGLFVLPAAVITTVLAVFLVLKAVLDSIRIIKKDFIIWQAINYSAPFWEITKEFFVRLFYSFFGDPKMIFLLVLLASLVSYLIYSKRKTRNTSPLMYSLILYLIGFTFLLVFWWIVALVYALLNREVKWR